MKYVFNLSFFLFGFLLVFLLGFSYDNDVMTVIADSEIDENTYQILDIYATNLTTKNFNKYFNDTSIILAIYPKINTMYKHKLNNISFACNKNCTIDEFANYYYDVLEENNFKSDAINAKYYGVIIKKIRVYSNKETLAKLLKKCSICFLK